MTFILVAVSIVALLWGGLYLWRGSLELGGTLFLIVGYCAGREVLRFSLGPLPMTLERPVLAVLIAAVLCRCALRENPPRRFSLVEWLLVLFALLLTGSTFLHDWQRDNYAPIYRLVACYLMPIALYLVVRLAPLSGRSVRGTYLVLTLFGVYLAITAIGEFSQQWWLVFPQYITDPKLGIHFGRARGPALQAQSLGLYVGLCGLCAWVWLAQLGPLSRLSRWCLLPVFLGALFCTSTRSVWLGAALAALVVCGLSTSKPWRPFALGLFGLLGLLVVLLRGGNWTDLQRGDQSAAAARDSVDHRRVYAYVSWLMFQDRPWLGCGAGQFIPESVPYLNDHAVPLYLPKIKNIPHHNTFLCLLVETGIVGGGLYIAILFGWLHQARQLWTAAAVPAWARWQGLLLMAGLGMYLPDALFFDPGSFAHQDHYFVFFLAGLTSGIHAKFCGAVQENTAAISRPEAASVASAPLGLGLAQSASSAQ